MQPSEAWQALQEGNRRFASDRAEGLRRDGARLRALVEGQQPFAAVLGCADSRVPPELLFDQGLGDIFTVRVAGNVLGETVLASLEYAVHVLNTPLVLVLGHSRCGAVGAALQAFKSGEGLDNPLVERLRPAVKALSEGGEVADRWPRAIVANARQVAATLRSHSAFSPKLTSGALEIRAAVYHLETGEVELLS